MKKIVLLGLALGIGTLGFAQKANIPSNLKNKSALVEPTTAETFNFNKSPNQTTSTKGVTSLSEAHIGNSRYDLQTNSTTQNRIYAFADGTIGATWTQGFDLGIAR